MVKPDRILVVIDFGRVFEGAPRGNDDEPPRRFEIRRP